MSLRTTARRSLAIAAAALGCLAVATPARAQFTGTVTYNGPTTSATKWGYAVGPVSETATVSALPGQTLALTAFCVDFLNSIQAPTTYNANITSLGLVLAGQATLENTRHTTAADKNAFLAGYKKAAWLTDQFALFAGETSAAQTDHYAALQGALWAVFTPSAVTLDAGTSTTNDTVVEYWQKRANDFAASAAFSTYDYSRFYVITDVAAKGVASGRGVQEFMTAYPTATVPEPSTVVLLGAGLAAVGGAARRRRAA